jgi:hypothetical protein
MDKEMTVRFFNTHDALVQPVLSSGVDTGMVRTDTLEQMSASGVIQLSDIRALVFKTVTARGTTFTLQLPLDTVN